MQRDIKMLEEICKYIKDCKSKVEENCTRQDNCMVYKFYEQFKSQHPQIARFYLRFGYDWKEQKDFRSCVLLDKERIRV